MKERSAVVTSVCLWRLKLPLKQPYHLSFGTVREYDTVIARVEADGVEGWGESTPLPGYSEETADLVWAFVTSAAGALPGLSTESALRRVEQAGAPGFSRVALMVALEEAQWQGGGRAGDAYWKDVEGKDVPLAAIVDLSDPEGGLRAGERAVAEGYGTLKTKVALPPADPAKEAERCVRLRQAVGSSVRLRADANQGYTRAQAIEFLKRAQPAKLEWLEQPLPVDQWKDMERVYANRGNIPIMLDEAIVSEKDVIRCTRPRCADVIKLKLMKQGSLSACLETAQRARESGLRVVIGNGVQTGLACLQEARLHARIDPALAGEENGFLKPVRDVLRTAMTVRRGRLSIERNEPDVDFLEKSALEKRTYAADRIPGKTSGRRPRS